MIPQNILAEKWKYSPDGVVLLTFLPFPSIILQCSMLQFAGILVFLLFC